MDATAEEEMYQIRAMIIGEQKTGGVGGGRFRTADLCNRERNRFSSVVPMLDVAFQVDVNKFKDQV